MTGRRAKILESRVRLYRVTSNIRVIVTTRVHKNRVKLYRVVN
jgi:hypothetical protein